MVNLPWLVPSDSIRWRLPSPKVRVTPAVVQLNVVKVLSADRLVFAVNVAVLKVLLAVSVVPSPVKEAASKVFVPLSVMPVPEKVAWENVLSPLSVMLLPEKLAWAKVLFPLIVMPVPEKLALV